MFIYLIIVIVCILILTSGLMLGLEVWGHDVLALVATHFGDLGLATHQSWATLTKYVARVLITAGVCVGGWMYVCMYIYVCLYICIYMYVFMYEYMVYIFICMHICMYVCIHGIYV